MFSDIDDYIASFHGDDDVLKNFKGEENKWSIAKNCDDLDIKANVNYYQFHTAKIINTDQDIFYEVCYFVKNAFHTVIYFLGSTDEATKFSCIISVKNEDGEKFLYTGKIHTFDEKADDIIATETCFKVGKNCVNRCLYEERLPMGRDIEKNLYVDISIKSRKEEAKDDYDKDE